jgi:nucleoside-diphosphate-sugar epimerase
MACISVNKVVQSMIHASRIEFPSTNRTVLLTGIPVTAQQMWDAVKQKARASVAFDPDPRIQAIMDSVPKATRSARAARLGFPHSRDIEEIVREYEEAAVAHNG